MWMIEYLEKVDLRKGAGPRSCDDYQEEDDKRKDGEKDVEHGPEFDQRNHEGRFEEKCDTLGFYIVECGDETCFA
jgi:hypothetical protein